MACLDERLAELDASVSVLASGGPDAVNRVTAVVERMAPLAVCAGASAGRLDAEPCEDCVMLRADLERVRSLRNLGRFAEAERVAKETLARPASPAAAEVRTSLQIEHARLQDPLGHLDDGEREMFDAVLAAHRAGSRSLAAEAFAELAYLVGYQRVRPDDGERWALQAEALVTENDAQLVERIASVRGVIEARRGNLRVAEDHFRRAEASVRKRLGSAHPLRARALSNLASAILHQNRVDDALPLLKEAYDLLVAALGADHPDSFQALNSWGAALGDAGRFAEAVPVFEAALAGYKRTLGANHPRIGTAALNLAEALFRLKRYADARPAIAKPRTPGSARSAPTRPSAPPRSPASLKSTSPREPAPRPWRRPSRRWPSAPRARASRGAPRQSSSSTRRPWSAPAALSPRPLCTRAAPSPFSSAGSAAAEQVTEIEEWLR